MTRAVLALLLLASTASARTLTLDEAVRLALAEKPALKQARAGVDVALARADEARAPILPQLNGVAAYSRTTANFVPRPGALPSSATGATNTQSWNSANFFNFGLTLTQFIWDFGVTTDRWRAARVTAAAQQSSERATRLGVVLGVVGGYLNAAAQTQLVAVARDTLANQERHLEQITRFVAAGTRPEIDLAQARADRANAQLTLINVENALALAKAQLEQAIGTRNALGEFDVELQPLHALDGEDGSIEALVDEGERSRPEMRALADQVRAQELLVSSAKGAYGPVVSASASLTDAGTDLTNMAWNLSGGVNLTWSLFSGLGTWSQVKEQQATLRSLQAARELQRQQIRVDVTQAHLSIRAGKVSIRAADEVLVNTRERLRLAEARYQGGLGSIIELADAQVAVTTAAAQVVQAQLNLSLARAQLRQSLGRD